ANVTVTPGTGLTALTNSTGGYSFSDLLNGTYSVAVSKDGYTGQTVSVTVSGANVQKDLTLAETGGGNTGPTTKNPGGSGASPNFLSTPTGIASIAVVVVVVVAAIGAAVVLARRKRGAGGSRPSDPAGSPPPDGPNGG
ncbi:MAG TPA: carboxypeptidase-like regulatory domain-containing protein, partial [Thermoplasmata archaeon]|nr:carboxypeptidase-like regulatory domain-containing protein [Thermoplasmata archaeon]